MPSLIASLDCSARSVDFEAALQRLKDCLPDSDCASSSEEEEVVELQEGYNSSRSGKAKAFEPPLLAYFAPNPWQWQAGLLIDDTELCALCRHLDPEQRQEGRQASHSFFSAARLPPLCPP